MMPSDGGSLCDELDDDHDEVAESDDETDYQTHMDGANQRSHGQNSVEGHLACLDDETLFGVVKKLVCTFPTASLYIFSVLFHQLLQVDFFTFW
jgi:hypothetical protein